MNEPTTSEATSADDSRVAGVGGPLWNVPNQLTVARLALSVICFVFLAIGWYGVGLIVFVLAASTDWVDGYWARRYGQITQLGRVLDPFADKIVICGTFIFLAAKPDSLIQPWMAVVVVARELLITAIRSFFEERSIDFSAQTAGKWKMLLQCLAVAFSMYRLTYFATVADLPTSPAPPWLTSATIALVWGAIAMTIYSGWGYVRTALKMMSA